MMMQEQSENIIEVSTATFDTEVLARSHEKPVVVDFWAAWCGPCRMLGPLLEKLANEPGSNFILAKVDVDDNQSLAQEFDVRGIPAVKGFRDGRVVAEFVGAQPEGQVRQFLRQVAPSTVDRLLSEANAYFLGRDWDKAEAAYQKVLAEYSDQQDAQLGLARAQLMQGKGCQAAALLADISTARYLDIVEKLQPLADYLCRMSEPVGGEVTDELSALTAQYRHAAQLIQRENMPAALDGLLEILRQDKYYADGEAKAVVLGLFELLGPENPLTRQYRGQLAMILF
jgi:putative thioredoxin